MNAIQAKEIVILIRVLRDGSMTEERLERWLAELVIGCISGEEPHVARAKITPLPIDEYRQRAYPVMRRSNHHAYQHALALEIARITGALNLVSTSAPLVA